jgi:predicted nucleotidyltransferase component of viral defense system
MTVLTPVQRSFLAKFFARANARAFYLTGGGALAEYYLGHRLSQDLDLFTQDREAWQRVEEDLKIAAQECGVGLEFSRAREPNELHRAFLKVPGEPGLKIDIVRDTPPHFGEPQMRPDGVIVDTLENIAVGKLLAAYGRAYPRDFVDLYVLLESGYDFHKLMALAKEKDPGLDEFHLAGMFRLITQLQEKTLPPMLTPLNAERMKQFFLKLADELSQGRE